MADDKTFTQADIDAAIEKAVGPLKESVDKLTDKNSELIGENRRLKSKGEIKPEDLDAANERADKAEGRVKELEGSVKALTKERDTAAKTLEAEQGFTQKLLIQDGIKSALIANGVKDEDFIDSLTAKFSGMASIKADGENRVALIGDKPVADHFKEWAATDQGKKFISAPTNSGGGAGGGNGKGATAKTMTRSAFEGLDPSAKVAFSKEGGALTDG